MARDGTSPSAKGKGKAYALPTRASPRLEVLRAQALPSSSAPTLPPSNHPAPAPPAVPAPAAGRKTTWISVKPVRRSSGEEEPLGDDPCYWQYDDFSDWQNADPSDSSEGCCTRPPPAVL
ncbi:hypothetical protein PIB30_095050 [Stylosanthes scabra]|uniref:Uncharacterized protein n=1 Tax=Stylosanthes scabra TaxID=79078 RepID=A0ABU6ZU92_9FABA|nr:hypothetical protein [Stylosanthes scabra]